MSSDELLILARGGDKAAAGYLQVKLFNAEIYIGKLVAYVKSDLEGRVNLKIAGEAFMLHPESQPMVTLAHVGDVLLSRVEIQPIPNFNTPSIFSWLQRYFNNI